MPVGCWMPAQAKLPRTVGALRLLMSTSVTLSFQSETEAIWPSADSATLMIG